MAGNSKATDLSFLAGGGEMGALMRSHDWSNTAVGNPEQWPAGLKTIIGVLLHSKFPMLLCWGDDFIQFYNDAYRPSFGTYGKHPTALGQRAQDCWPETWAEYSPLLLKIRNGGSTDLEEDRLVPMHRNGQLEDTYWTYSYSPVSDDDGSIGGVLSVSMETTGKVVSNRQLKEKQWETAGIIEQAPVAIALLKGRDLAIEIMNDRLAALWEKDQSVIGMRLADALPELRGKPYLQLLQDVFNNDAAYKGNGVRASLVTKGASDKGYYDFSYTPVHDAEGKVNSILIVATDVTDRETRHKVVADSEARFRALIEEAPIATALFVGKELKVEVANEAMKTIWGKRDVIGKTLIQVLPELEGQPFTALMERVLYTGIQFNATNAPAQLLIDGAFVTRYYNYNFTPLLDAKGNAYAIMNMATDVTKHVVAAQQLEESELFSRTVIDHSPIATTVMLGDEFIVSVANQNMLRLIGKDESIIGQSLKEVLPDIALAPTYNRLQEVYATGETYVQPEEKMKLILHGQPYTGYYSYIHKALYNTAGEIYGVITTASEITAQVLARQQVEEAEVALNVAIELAELGSWQLDVATGQITYSYRLRDWLGLTEATVADAPSPRVHPDDQLKIQLAMREALKPGGTGVFDEVYTIVHQQTGQARIIHSNGQAIFNGAGQPVSISGVVQDVTLQREQQLALENEVRIRTEQLGIANLALHKANEELNAANEELSCTNEEINSTNDQLAVVNLRLNSSGEELGRYARASSKHLQELLTRIKLLSGLLQHHQQLSDESRMAAEEIKQAAENMTVIVGDMKEFSTHLHE